MMKTTRLVVAIVRMMSAMAVMMMLVVLVVIRVALVRAGKVNSGRRWSETVTN